MQDLVIGLFFLVNASTGQPVDQMVSGFPSYEACLEVLQMVKVSASQEYVDSKVIGICIPGENIQ